MKNVYDFLKRRGYIKQTTNEEGLRKKLNEEKVTLYCGFDPTKPSLHIGHLMQILICKNLQDAGHRIICVIGGGTAMVGDPTGKDNMREMLTQQNIQDNIAKIKKQLALFLDFSDEKALVVDNYEWLGHQNYIDFLRFIGPNFTVNRMLTAECFKQRMEKGLTFLEFNYMIMQAFDYYQLFKRYDCTLQIGGDDQWSNMLAGMDLIRRTEAKEVYCMTSPLLSKSDGKKMGKTEGGAVWIDPELLSPYEYFQFWRNSGDDEVNTRLRYYTFVPTEEIEEYEKLEGQELNKVKEILAYEQTKIVHGEEEAKKALEASKQVFAGNSASADAPTIEMGKSAVVGQTVADISVEVKLFGSKGEAKRMIKQGGLYLNGEQVNDFNYNISENDIADGKIGFRKGKKKFLFIDIK